MKTVRFSVQPGELQDPNHPAWKALSERLTFKYHRENLIEELRCHGVTVNTNDIPTIVRRGIDAYLRSKGAVIPEKDMTTLYLILDSIKGNWNLTKPDKT